MKEPVGAQLHQRPWRNSRDASDRAVPFEHVSPFSLSPGDHLGALMGRIAAAAAAGRMADATGLAAAAAVGDNWGRDPCALQRTVFVRLNRLVDLSARTPV
jgi:hypothetical protein